MDEKVEQKKEEVKSEEVKPQAAPAEITLKEAEYRKLVEDASSFKDKYVRLLAEFDNARKRNERERADLIKYAHEEVIVEVLNIYEDLERSLEAAKRFNSDIAIVKGLEMVVENMRGLLKGYNVKPVETVGKKFDPTCHEAMMQAETKEFEDDAVMEEFQKGWWLGDRVVRTAKVKVAKNQ